MGRFESQHDPAVLLAVLGDVLRLADPVHPETVSQRAYDRARVTHGYDGTPRADKLAARWRVSWDVLRDHALHAPDPATALAVSSSRRVRRVLSRAEAVSAVRRVATMLGVEHLSPHEYNVGRERIDAQATGRYRHGAHLVPLPTGDVIRQSLGWHSVVSEAGLTDVRWSQPCLARADAIVAFIETYGYRPRKLDIDWFGRHHAIQLVNHTAEGHRASLVRAQARFEALGRHWFPPPTPYGFTPHEHWGTWGRHVAGADGDTSAWDEAMAGLAALATAYPRRRTKGEPWTLDQIRVAISEAFDAVGPGNRLTTDRYRALSRDPRFPNMVVIARRAKEQGTSFRALVQDEARLRARRARGG